MTLTMYNKKRNFKKTPEPKGMKARHEEALRFIVQKHDASQLHYDFRLEMDGVMKSWAVPKGPSLNPTEKRLAMQVEDHPISYNTFEGHIPLGQYGGGDVIVWDQGTYHLPQTTNPYINEKVFIDELERGRMKFVLEGKKLKGIFSLFHFGEKNQWMLVKFQDMYARKTDITKDPRSVVSRKKLIGRREDPKKYAKAVKKSKKV
ncbi:MAG: ligD [Candidatus Kaiserbacteria bacterium]|nr:ligD [Candidatus Kaiserbacteria bacterium]